MFLDSRLGSFLALSLACGTTTAAQSAKTLPSNYGVAVYPAFEALDVFGPLNILNFLSYSETMNLAVLSTTLDPVSTKPQVMNPAGSDFGESIVPTHTFDNPPEDLEVLIVPGGIGTRSADVTGPIVDFVKQTYLKLRYLISICTGGAILAESGVLDGKNATTNKRSWEWATSKGPNVCWDAHVRWASDGNIWTSSGISAGIDAMYAFVAAIYGEDVAANIALNQEYRRITDPSDDPFGYYWNATSKPCK